MCEDDSGTSAIARVAFAFRLNAARAHAVEPAGRSGVGRNLSGIAGYQSRMPSVGRRKKPARVDEPRSDAECLGGGA